jgi:sigma-B regulation protein RsbU (phosphoserine phosphatase)
MTVADLEHFNQVLTEQQESLIEWLNSGHSIAEGDAAKVQSLLGDIKDALARIADRSYGACKACDGEVELDRLNLQPVRQICLDCISAEEKAVLEEDLYLASKIHRALLPQAVPKIRGFEVSVQSVAASNVGGDYYDFLPGGKDGAMLVVIADAMGKGMAAGLLMSNLQGALRILAPEFDSPGALMTRLNRWFCRNVPVTKFVSMALIRLRENAGSESVLTYANAGHCPPIVVRNGGRVETLAETGGILGVHEEFAYEDRTLRLSAGELVVLYTDGVTEAENRRGEMFEDQRLIELVQSHRDDSTSAIMSGILDAVQSFCGRSDLGDDYTVVTMRKE